MVHAGNARKIIGRCGLTRDDVILEIGPGKGILTREIAPRVHKVIAVEKDRRLTQHLTHLLERFDNLEVFWEDILKTDWTSLPQGLKVIGNLPYYISSPIIEILIRNREKIKSAYITVQREFAERMVSGPGTKHYSALSVFVQMYAVPRVLLSIPKGAFRPVPKVSSCLVSLEFPGRTPFPLDRPQDFFDLVQRAFQQRRKTLPNALGPVMGKTRAENILNSLKLAKDNRPENLSIEDYVALYRRWKAEEGGDEAADCP